LKMCKRGIPSLKDHSWRH